MIDRTIARSLAVVLTAAAPVLAQGHAGGKAEEPAKHTDKPAAAATAAPPAAPAPAGATGLPKPPPEMDQLKSFAGSWSCEGTIGASVLAPAHKIKGGIKVRRDLAGFWYSGTARHLRLPDNPAPLDATFHIGWDTAGKRLLMLWVDAFGTWATQTSPGLTGDKLVFSGEATMMGRKVPVRDTYERKGDMELVHTYEMVLDGAKTTTEERCQKAPLAVPDN